MDEYSGRKSLIFWQNQIDYESRISIWNWSPSVYFISDFELGFSGMSWLLQFLVAVAFSVLVVAERIWLFLSHFVFCFPHIAIDLPAQINPQCFDENQCFIDLLSFRLIEYHIVAMLSSKTTSAVVVVFWRSFVFSTVVCVCVSVFTKKHSS